MVERMQAQTRELAQQSEAQYRALFESLTEGFCTVEVIFDAWRQGRGLSLPQYESGFFSAYRHCQCRRPANARYRSGSRDSWFEIFGRIALTGYIGSFENYAAPLGRHYEVSAFRVGGDGSRKVAIVFSDVTERKDRELKRQAQLERLALLQQITRAIGERQDLPSIFQIVVRTLEDQLPVDFACICLYEPEAGNCW